MAIADGLLEIVNEAMSGNYELKYLKNHVAISEQGDWRNVVSLGPKKQYIHLWRLRVNDPDEWLSRIEEIGLPVAKGRQNRIRLTVTPEQFKQHRSLLQKLIHEVLGLDAEESES